MTQQQVDTENQPDTAPFIAITDQDILRWYAVDMVEERDEGEKLPWEALSPEHQRELLWRMKRAATKAVDQVCEAAADACDEYLREHGLI